MSFGKRRLHDNAQNIKGTGYQVCIVCHLQNIQYMCVYFLQSEVQILYIHICKPHAHANTVYSVIHLIYSETFTKDYFSRQPNLKKKQTERTHYHYLYNFI